jgi:acetate---CoA ligase (ADP-forming)
MFRSVNSLLRPRSIAVLGASETGGGGWTKAIHGNLAHAGCTTKLYLVNPKRGELWGEKVYGDISEIPEPVDLALAIIPAPAIPDALTSATQHGLKAALIYASQFGENGDPDGVARAARVKALCEAEGLRVGGPNCMGVLALRERLLLYPTARVRALPAGSVGVVFQSGGTFQFWLQQAATRGLGFSYAVSSGNELDLDLADYINFLVEDEETKLIACMVEGVRRPEAFMAVAAKALAAKKPILLVKLGRSAGGKAAAASHTGALAGDDRVFDAVCRKYGIVRCPSLDDLIETCLVFAQSRVPSGNRVAMVGQSGGAKGLFLDYASDSGLELAHLSPATAEALRPMIDPGLAPENPLDTGASLATNLAAFGKVCRVVCADPGVDIVTVQGQLPIAPGENTDAGGFAAIAAATGKPVVAFGRMAQNVTEIGRKFQQDAGMPFLQGMPQTARALRSLADYGRVMREGAAAPLPAPGNDPDTDLSSILAAHGLTEPRSALARNADEAADKAAAVGFPVVVKLISPAASHKTEVGAVTLNLTDAPSVRDAALAMQRRLEALVPGAAVDGFLVQEMVSGVEMIVGVRDDPQYGPLMAVGLGGIFVEVLQDLAIRLLPVDAAMAREMLLSLRGAALFGAFRGAKPRDVEAVARAIAGLSEVFLEHRAKFSDIEVNPLIVLADGEGVRAVDVRTVKREGGPLRHRRPGESRDDG